MNELALCSIEDLQKLLMKNVNINLPTLAKAGRWVVFQNHCFMRILLDNLYQDCWYNYLDRKSVLAAYKQLSVSQLITLIEMCVLIQNKGSRYLDTLNVNSLRWRGKLK